MTVDCPFWVVRAATAMVGRGQLLCLGVQLNCEKLKVFFKSLGLLAGCIEVFEIFFQKNIGCNFFKYLRAHT
jgi:hypothetical protein